MGLSHSYVKSLFERGLLPCRQCRGELSLDQFSRHKSAKFGYRYECRACRAELRKNEWFGKYSKTKKVNYKEKYGYEPDRPMPSTCEICNIEGRLVFDHCHETNTFRGWLCKQCNYGLGLFKDNASALASASKYIVAHSDSRPSQ